MMKNHIAPNDGETERKMVDIESKDQISAKSIRELGDQPKLLKDYLESSIGNTFSELIFRYSHEVFAEDMNIVLLKKVNLERTNLKKTWARYSYTCCRSRLPLQYHMRYLKPKKDNL